MNLEIEQRARSQEAKKGPARRVWVNSNRNRPAYDAASAGGTIEIILEEKDLKSIIHVKDCGIGITEENGISLFDGFCPATKD